MFSSCNTAARHMKSRDTNHSSVRLVKCNCQCAFKICLQTFDSFDNQGSGPPNLTYSQFFTSLASSGDLLLTQTFVGKAKDSLDLVDQSLWLLMYSYLVPSGHMSSSF